MVGIEPTYIDILEWFILHTPINQNVQFHYDLCILLIIFVLNNVPIVFDPYSIDINKEIGKRP